MRNSRLLYAGGAALLSAAACCAQNASWEGETGVFITPMAYTAASGTSGLGKPIVAYHYLYGGAVLGDFHELSITDGAFGRIEFGYTRAFHQVGRVYALSPLWHDGFNIFHAKANLIPENAGGRKWLPAIAVGVIVRTQVHNVGAVCV